MNVSRKPFIVAHRGASHDAPENTLSSFKLAWEQNADAIECDVWMTKDQSLVCIHDKTTKRISSNVLDVTESMLEDLKEIEWQNERIPLLEEVLAIVPEDKRIVIEIKDELRVLLFLVQAIDSSGLSNEQIIIISFDGEVVREAKKVLPNIKTLLLLKDVPEKGDIMEILKNVNVDGVDVKDSKKVDAKFVEEFHSAGLEVHVWTVNDKKPLMRYVGIGVDSVTTDKPGVMLSLVR